MISIYFQGKPFNISLIQVYAPTADAKEAEVDQFYEDLEDLLELNAEFQRITRTDQKTFLNGQYKEIEKNNRKGKARDLFKEIGNIKGTFHPKMGTIKDRNGKDLMEVEMINKRWKEYTEELYNKDLNDLDNHDDVVSHAEPDILECEVK